MPNEINPPGPRPRKVPYERSLFSVRPDLATELDRDRATDLGLDMYAIAAGTHALLPWRHSASNGAKHRWLQTGSSRVHMNAGCPICRGYVADRTTSLAMARPKLAREWHPTENGHRTPRQVTPGSRREVAWLCSKCTYTWEARISSRALDGNGCPRCAGQVAQPGDGATLAVAHPELFAEVDQPQAARLGIDTRRVLVRSQRPLPWRCRHDSGHRWTATPAARMNGCVCPHCPSMARTSATERRLLTLLRRHFEGATGDTPAGTTRWADSRGRLIAARCDVVISSRRLVVEYDGVRYHQSGDRRRCDTEKTAALLADGWRVVRIREHTSTSTLPTLGITALEFLALPRRYGSPLSPVVDHIIRWLERPDE